MPGPANPIVVVVRAFGKFPELIVTRGWTVVIFGFCFCDRVSELQASLWTGIGQGFNVGFCSGWRRIFPADPETDGLRGEGRGLAVEQFVGQGRFAAEERFRLIGTPNLPGIAGDGLKTAVCRNSDKILRLISFFSFTVAAGVLHFQLHLKSRLSGKESMLNSNCGMRGVATVADE